MDIAYKFSHLCEVAPLIEENATLSEFLEQAMIAAIVADHLLKKV